MKKIEDLMQEHLADLLCVYLKVYKYHWNLKGENFISIHRYYQEIFEYLVEVIDETAERMRVLGIYCPCSTLEIAKYSKIDEQEGFTLSVDETIAIVSKDLELLIQNILNICKASDDASVGLFNNHELALSKMVWFLSSSL